MSASSQRRWSIATVVDAVDAADSIRRICLEYAAPVAGGIEGSHLDVDVQVDGKTEIRSYSVAARGSDNKTLVLGVHLSPHTRGGSSYMHALRPGMTIRTSQPLTSFPFSRSASSSQFLAGGIGVTALMSMATAVKAQTNSGGVGDYRFTYVGRKRGSMAFLDDLTREHGDDLAVHTSDDMGRFDVDEFVADIPEHSILYVCGPVGMLDAVRTAWSDSGRPAASLRYETFGTTGKFPTAEFVVRVPKQGLEVVVKANESMLEALEAAGAEVMFDCKKGECGLCQVDIRSVEGVVDHRDVFFSSRQQESNTRLCTCVTRIACAGNGSLPAVAIDLP